ncbi:nadp-binding [Trichoderma arundinaceum]|uniref:Nadp-binding n=1 Tax=Trichoderma arundinaceum TaxID=490622 RepID=A0A395NQL8_TRIAR|nr:nadp-binding [Trichoderma arundinaceum]
MTNNPKILIAGAAGRTGSIATRMLLERGFPVRAMVRQDDERARKLADLGAEIFVGDVLDLRSMRRAFDGVKRAYFVYPMQPGLVEATANYAMAAIEAKAEFILNISQRTSRPDATSDSAMHHWLAERVFDWAPIPVTHLQPTAFNEWLTAMQKQIREGRYAVPFGPKGHFAPISCEDQGAVITEILADPSSHVGQTYQLLGPVELTPPEIADIVSKTLGKEVRYEQISGEQWVREVTGRDLPYLSQHVQGIAPMHEKELMSGTNDVVQRITGRRPETVEDFVKRHREILTG